MYSRCRRAILACLIAYFAAIPVLADPPAPLGREYQSAIIRAVDGQSIAPPRRLVHIDGQLVTSVEWYGFDRSDSTRYIVDALQSAATVVVFPKTQSEWITGPIHIPSGKTLVLAEGVVIRALPGQFTGANDCLFSSDNVRDVTIIGYGARLVMNKSDYVKAPYRKAEWRSGIQFRGSSNIRIEGVTVASTGGDGIYLGATPLQPYCADVLVSHVRLLDNYRQGISVISARNLLIDAASILFTSGTYPMAGIDFEPNPGTYGFENCVVRKTEIWLNSGGSIFIIIGPNKITSKHVSITIDDCFFGAPRQPPRILIEAPEAEGEILLTGSSQGPVRLQANLSDVRIIGGNR
jgi:hypothetical protein